MSKDFYGKLLAVQKNLKAPKSQYNSFGKYSYRNCEDILEAVKPLLAEQGLVLTLKDSIEPLGDRYYVRAVAALTDGETTEQVFAYAREEDVKKGMDASQITGAASSYARKYALNGLFCIDDTKDADSDGSEPVYKCADCGMVFKGCTEKQYKELQAASKDGKARCKKCREELNNA